MKAWLADTFSDEEGKTPVQGKCVMLFGTKAEVASIAKFLADVVRHLEDASYCHMHLRDNMSGWSEAKHIDLEITVDERNT